MGKPFGSLYTIRGIVYSKLSPHELNVMSSFGAGLNNIVTHRTFPKIFYWLPPFVIGYAVYTWAEAAHAKLQRKNLDDFKDEVPPPPPPPPSPPKKKKSWWCDDKDKDDKGKKGKK